MEYKTGFSVKPSAITRIGKVIFTDGTNDITPNQLECEAYGYTYNNTTGTCSAFRTNIGIDRSASNIDNFIKGKNNTTETGTTNTIIMGQSNIVKGNSRNNILIGDNNEVSIGINNATVLGNYGLAERDGEVVIGGGAFNGAGKGYGQSSTITLSGTTTDATQTNLFVNSSSSNTIIARAEPTGSVRTFQGFEANVLGIRTGGSSGSGALYDRILLRATGIIYFKASNESVSTLGSFGTVAGWTSAMDFSGTNEMHLSVTGAADMNISWSATLHLYEIKV